MELDFDNETIEKLLLKRALNDKKWLSILTNVYECLFKSTNPKYRDKKTLFSDPTVSLIAKLAMKYYQKHASTANSKIIQLLAKKYQEIHEADGAKVDLAKVSEVLTDV